MGKLKNYEIDAIIATIETRFREKKNNKIQELVNTISLNENEKQLFSLITDYNRYSNIVKELENAITPLYKELMPKDVPWGWRDTTEEKLKRTKAISLVDTDINLYSIRNELILNNIEGADVTNFIEEVLNRYNFND